MWDWGKLPWTRVVVVIELADKRKDGVQQLVSAAWVIPFK